MRARCSRAASVVLVVLASACGLSAPSPDDAGHRSSADPDGGAPRAPSPPAASCADTQRDPRNCGACAFACSFPNAAPLCSTGRCVRGACAPGWYDLDGDPADGCEATCSGTTCTVGSGSTLRTVVLSAPPVPETGAVAGALASSGAVTAGAAGVLGEATPLAARVDGLDGALAPPVDTRNQLFENHVGYQAALR